MTQQLLTCEFCGVEFPRLYQSGPPPKYCSRSHRQRAYEKRGIDKLKGDNRWLVKKNRKLQERLNRIAKLTPGHGRLNKLDAIALEFKVDADEIMERTKGNPSDAQMEQIAMCEEYALILERFEWDLRRLRDVVRGNPRKDAQVNYNTGKYDVTNWEGERP